MKTLANKIYEHADDRKNDWELKFETTKNFKNDVLVRIPSVQKFTDTFSEWRFKPVDESISLCVKHTVDKS